MKSGGLAPLRLRQGLKTCMPFLETLDVNFVYNQIRDALILPLPLQTYSTTRVCFSLPRLHCMASLWPLALLAIQPCASQSQSCFTQILLFFLYLATYWLSMEFHREVVMNNQLQLLEFSKNTTTHYSDEMMLIQHKNLVKFISVFLYIHVCIHSVRIWVFFSTHIWSLLFSFSQMLLDFAVVVFLYMTTLNNVYFIIICLFFCQH